MLNNDSNEVGGTILFGKHSKSEVIARYFNKRPLFVRGAIVSPEALLDFEAFYTSLSDTENVRAIFNSMHRASIAPNDAHDMFSAGATICVTGIDLAVPAIRELSRQVQCEFGYLGTVSVNAYCSPVDSGLSKHYDPRIVTVIQLAGTKRWVFSREPFEPNPLCVSYSDVGREALLEAHNKCVGTESVTLSAGDVLCLPAGTVHEARAESRSLSLNLAFDYIGDGVADLLTKWLCKELLRIPEFRNPCFENGDLLQDQIIRRAIDRVEEMVSKLRKNPCDFLSPANRD